MALDTATPLMASTLFAEAITMTISSNDRAVSQPIDNYGVNSG